MHVGCPYVCPACSSIPVPAGPDVGQPGMPDEDGPPVAIRYRYARGLAGRHAAAAEARVGSYVIGPSSSRTPGCLPYGPAGTAGTDKRTGFLPVSRTDRCRLDRTCKHATPSNQVCRWREGKAGGSDSGRRHHHRGEICRLDRKHPNSGKNHFQDMRKIIRSAPDLPPPKFETKPLVMAPDPGRFWIRRGRAGQVPEPPHESGRRPKARHDSYTKPGGGRLCP